MTTTVVSTRVAAGSPQQHTNLTVDWDGITTEQLQAGFLAFAIVKLQGNWRQNGIPQSVTVKAVDLAPGKRLAAPMTPEQAEAVLLAEAKSSPEKRAALLAKLQELQDAEE